MTREKKRRLRKHFPLAQRHIPNRIVRRRLGHEPLEARLALDGTGLPGNECPPDLDLSAVAVQSARTGDELVLDLLAAGGTVVDLNADGSSTGDTIHFLLDPDDTPAGATMTAEGVFRWTPTTDQVGTFEFVVLAVDSGDPPLADAEVFVVEVNPNTAPDLAAISDQFVGAGEMLEVTVTATDADGDELTFALDRDDPDSTVPDDAVLEQLSNTTAVIRWTPDAADAGASFAFSVIVTDDGFPPLADREVFMVEVSSITALDDAYEIGVDGELTVDAASGVLANDTDSDGDTLTAAVVASPTHGTLTLGGDGSFSYTPDAGFQGTDTFTYRAEDGTGDAGEALVVIQVNAIPAAVDDAFTVNEDMSLVVNAASGVLSNDSDPDGDTLMATLVDDVTSGTLTFGIDGSFTYVPDADFNGTDLFTYRATDGIVDSAEATVTITVNAVNDAPAAVADEYSVDEDATLSVDAANGVLSNDTDSDGDTLTANLVDNVTSGTLTLNADGSFTYTPNADFSGVDAFTYAASDGTDMTSATQVTITVAEQNAFSVAENSPAGTVVGQVVPETPLGSTVVYTIDDPSLDPLLELAADDHVTGNPAGPVVLVEYVDFQCPVCLQYHPIVEQLISLYPDDLMVVTRHFPLTSVHQNAFDAAIATEAAGRQGAFDAYGDLLFDRQDVWEFEADPQPFFESYATELGLDSAQFQADQADPDIALRIQRDLDAIMALGGTGTPTFFLGGQRISNPQSAQEFAMLIQAEAAATTDAFVVDRLTGEIIVRDAAALDFETTPSFTLTVNAIGLDASETITATIDLVDEAEQAGAATAALDPLDGAFADEEDWLNPLL